MFNLIIFLSCGNDNQCNVLNIVFHECGPLRDLEKREGESHPAFTGVGHDVGRGPQIS